MPDPAVKPTADAKDRSGPRPSRAPQPISEHIVEFVSDSGEGAQTAGVLFSTVCARLGAGVWTVELIPAEIEPPARSREGVSGNRIRFGDHEITNMGDGADVVVAFNEQVLYSRIDQDGLRDGTILYIDKVWATHADPAIREAYRTALADFAEHGLDVREVPMEQETLKIVSNPRRGKNMWAAGMLAAVYSMELDPFLEEVRGIFERKRKSEKIIKPNHDLLRAGYAWALENITERYTMPLKPATRPRVVMNGNAAVATGAMAAGFELCSMYPITPATSASHFLAGAFEQAGGFVHQAEDEIAAAGFAIGASYAGKTALTITSGPGMALKTEMIGLACMAELPLVIVDVQRGGPSTGLPTKVEQGDLLHALYGHPGDSPKIIIAPSTIEECFHYMIMARQLAETFRTPVIVLTDANLATGQSPFPFPELSEEWLSPPVDQSDWEAGIRPYEWDPETGLSRRPIPGQKGGNYVVTGLAHNEFSKIAYASAANERSTSMRSLKLASLKATLKPPKVYGPEEGDMLVVGWGSTRGAIEETVDQLRKEGVSVSSLHLRFLSPLEPGLAEIFAKFKKVMTFEINYSDEPTGALANPETRRFAQLAMMLRSATMVDVDCWSRIPGQPVPPSLVARGIRERMKGGV
jgi:2-oxoglutarate/2-oxoacid ferredoxin oxidoreductase subunit alpha